MLSLAKDFSFTFPGIRDLVTKKEKGRDNRVSYFLLLSCLYGWFRFTDSNMYRRGEFRDLNLWLLGLATFLSSVECRPLH